MPRVRSSGAPTRSTSRRSASHRSHPYPQSPAVRSPTVPAQTAPTPSQAPSTSDASSSTGNTQAPAPSTDQFLHWIQQAVQQQINAIVSGSPAHLLSLTLQLRGPQLAPLSSSLLVLPFLPLSQLYHLSTRPSLLRCRDQSPLPCLYHKRSQRPAVSQYHVLCMGP